MEVVYTKFETEIRTELVIQDKEVQTWSLEFGFEVVNRKLVAVNTKPGVENLRSRITNSKSGV